MHVIQPPRSARVGLVLTLATTLLMSGCIWTGWPFKRQPLEMPERPDPQRATAVEGVGWKVVSGKREPHFLIARDGTECTVTASKWKDMPVGEKAFCNWRVPGERTS